MDFEKPAWKIEAEKRGESLPGWYTLEEAAKVIGLADGSYLGRLARASKITTYKVGVYRFMDEKQLQALISKK